MILTKKALSNFQNGNTETHPSLNLEVLEDRMMLSTVEIFAAGATGQENLELFVNDQFVQTFSNVGGDASSRQFQRFVFQTDQTLTPGDIGIGFANDLFDPANGIDRDLIIDRIVVDGVTVQTEDPSTRSTGIFGPDGPTGAGFFQTETLNINGVFDFADPISSGGQVTGDLIEFDAVGTTGEELVNLVVDGQVVQTFGLFQSETTHSFRSNDPNVSLEDIRIEFVNDLFDALRGIDRNAQIFEFRVIDGDTGSVQTARTTDSNVLTSGIFSGGAITQGLGAGGFIAGDFNGNGFVEISGSDSGGGSTGSGDIIQFDAVGTTGEELVNLVVNGQVVQTFGLFQSETTFNFRSNDPNVSIEDIRIEFVNDLFDPARGIDRNAQIFEFRVIDGDTGAVQSARTTDANVLSSGIFADGAITQGFGAGGFLAGDFNGNGFVEISDAGQGPTALEQFESGFFNLTGSIGPQGQTVFVASVSAADVTFTENLPIGARPIRLIAAFDNNGAPLSGFGDNGIVNLTELLSPSIGLVDPVFSILDIEFFDDGSLLIAGDAVAGEDSFISGPLLVPGVTPVQFVAKLNPDLTLDVNFAQQGVLSGNFLQLNDSEVIFQTSLEAEIGPDGSVNLLAAVVDDFGGPFDVQNSSADLIVARFSGDDGTLDTTFGNNGTTIISSSEFEEPRFSAQDFQVDDQGGIFFILNTGITSLPSSGTGGIAIGRLLADGSRDVGFGDNGIFTRPASSIFAEVSPAGVIGVLGFDSDQSLPTLAILDSSSGDVISELTLDRGIEFSPDGNPVTTSTFLLGLTVDQFGNFLVNSQIVEQPVGGFQTDLGRIEQIVSPTGEIFATEFVA